MRRPAAPRIVGVIFSRADLQRALRMRNPPDLFELRLDGLVGCLDLVKTNLGELRAPLIITARAPREGGANALTPAQRRALLIDCLPRAAYLDIELRSLASFRTVRRRLEANRADLILSFHDFTDTPAAPRLDEIAAKAHAAGATVVKIATRTDKRAQLQRLLDFYERGRPELNLVVMGIGKLGRESRLELARRGCLLNYAHLGTARAAGQLSVAELRAAVR
jgi:3-dehydroquinate dehydratase type I